MRVFEAVLVSGGDMSVDVLSSAQNLGQVISGCVQAVFTGAPVGSLSLRVSNDNVTYTLYPNSATAVSAAGSAIWNLSDIGYLWIKVSYTATSGTGSLSATFCGKGV